MAHSVNVDLGQLEAEKKARDSILGRAYVEKPGDDQIDQDPVDDNQVDQEGAIASGPVDGPDPADVRAWSEKIEFALALAAGRYAPAWEYPEEGRQHLVQGLARQCATWFKSGGPGFDPSELHPLLQASWGLGIILLAQFDFETMRLKPRHQDQDQDQEQDQEPGRGGQVVPIGPEGFRTVTGGDDGSA